MNVTLQLNFEIMFKLPITIRQKFPTNYNMSQHLEGCHAFKCTCGPIETKSYLII